MTVCFGNATGSAADWPRWRGPSQDGHSAEKNLPVKWESDSVTWEAAVKGKGQSSPVIVGENIFLTSALRDGEERIVVCLNRNTGKENWSQTAWTGQPEKSHNMNGWASSTCAADDERVYAFFGKGGGLFCYSHDGKKLWQKELGQFDGPWGTAACPVLVGDLVIQNCDADTDAFLVAFHKVTGEQVWKTKRPDARGWSTPILINVDGRDELVLNGHHGVRAYAPASGKELWFCAGFSGRGSPTVAYSNGIVHAVCGLRGDTYAVRPGGDGDVTKTHMLWHNPRNTSRDLPSPIVIGNLSLVMDMRRATLSAYDLETGEQRWQKRVADAARSGQFCASPVAWNGTAFFVAESGQTFAIRPTNENMEIVSVNTVEASKSEIFRASPTPSEGQVFLRSDQFLYCIGKRVK